MAEASDFKFGIQLAFFKAHYQIAHRAKSVRGLWLGMLPKFGVPYNIFVTDEAIGISNLAYS